MQYPCFFRGWCKHPKTKYRWWSFNVTGQSLWDGQSRATGKSVKVEILKAVSTLQGCGRNCESVCKGEHLIQLLKCHLKCQHPISGHQALSLSSASAPGFLPAPWEEVHDYLSSWILVSHVGGLDWAPGCWIQRAPGMAIRRIWREHQLMEDGCLCLSLPSKLSKTKWIIFK